MNHATAKNTLKHNLSDEQLHALRHQIDSWASDLGFQQVGVSASDLGDHERHLERWLQAGRHGEMHYMEKHGTRRSRPAELLPGTLRIISVRMDYLPDDTATHAVLETPEKAYIARYCLGRDYHKLMRKRLAKLAGKIEDSVGGGQYRAFVDSAPVLERAAAEQAGLGWIGKNTMMINSKAGSWFFLGEIYTDLPLPIEPEPDQLHCGSCTACLDICPTNAFVGPFELDARRCISYLTIESVEPIPLELRPLMGNRIFGCDDCQLVCPWNKFAKPTGETDFQPRHGLDDVELLTLFNWSESDYLRNTEGSAMRRIGHERWLRNIAVALGNAPHDLATISALESQLEHPSPLVTEHVQWALEQQRQKAEGTGEPVRVI
ncbi:MAG: epoxyqueuosine reductase [Halieaceae bacterium]|jgi:epoxyqueuosine reductase